MKTMLEACLCNLCKAPEYKRIELCSCIVCGLYQCNCARDNCKYEYLDYEVKEKQNE